MDQVHNDVDLDVHVVLNTYIPNQKVYARWKVRFAEEPFELVFTTDKNGYIAVCVKDIQEAKLYDKNGKLILDTRDEKSISSRIVRAY